HLAFDLNGAVELFDDALGDGQAQSQAAALGRHEIVEDRRQALRRNARAAIADADLHAVARACGGDGDAAAGRRRLNRVGDEISIDATQSETIAFDDHRASPITRLDAHAGPLAFGAHRLHDLG